MAAARARGWSPGSRSDGTLYDEMRPLTLLDINYKRPKWERHLAVAQAERPSLPLVPDLLSHDGLATALEQATALAPYATEALLIVPKATGLIADLPRTIAGVPVRLAYSVPTRYGKTDVPLWEFAGWPVHLLGGSPMRQVEMAHYLDVRSADGNMARMVAQWGWIYTADGHSAHATEEVGPDFNYRCLCQSFENMPRVWQRAGFSTSILP
jgi:hypothetical protein